MPGKLNFSVNLTKKIDPGDKDFNKDEKLIYQTNILLFNNSSFSKFNFSILNVNNELQKINSSLSRILAKVGNFLLK